MRLVGSLAVRPQLWSTLMRQLWHLTPRQWWKRAPFLPVVPTEYIEMRNVIQYGNPHHPLVAHDFLSYLRWCREWNRYRS